MSRAHVFRWLKQFLKGRESIKDETRSGRLLSSKTNKSGRTRRIKIFQRSSRETWCETNPQKIVDVVSRQSSLPHDFYRLRFWPVKTFLWFLSLLIHPSCVNMISLGSQD